MIRSASTSAVASVPKIGGDFARFVASRQQTEYLIAPSIFGEDEHPSVIVRDKSEPGDRLGEIYERMVQTDSTLAGLLEKRNKAVLGLPYSIVPGDESDEAREIAEAVTQMVYGIRNIEVNLAHQLGATARGVAFEEMRWERMTRGPLKGLWAVTELVDRPMWRFGFKEGALHVRTKEGGLAPVPPGRILHLAHGTKDTPWGSALLDQVWWFYWLGLHAWKYYGVALEKWAQPTVLVPYARSQDGTPNEEVIARAQEVAANIQTEYAAAIPDDVKVQLLEATRGGHVSYEAFLHLLDRAKALVFLGEVDTSGLSQGPGSFAKNRVSNEVRYETILADACELANSLTDGLIAPFVRVNFGLDAPMPYWEFDVEEASDRKLRQEGVSAVIDQGLEVPESYLYRVHQVPQPKPGERTFKGKQSRPAAAPSPFPPKQTPDEDPDEDEAQARHWSERRLVA